MHGISVFDADCISETKIEMYMGKQRLQTKDSEICRDTVNFRIFFEIRVDIRKNL